MSLRTVFLPYGAGAPAARHVRVDAQHVPSYDSPAARCSVQTAPERARRDLSARQGEGNPMTEAAGLTGYSRAIDEILCPNALKVLEKRYLKKDDDGSAIEKPSDMFMRVAREHRRGGARMGSRRRAGRRGDARLLRAHDLARVPSELADADERRPRSPAALGVLRSSGRGLDGVDLRRGEGHRAHPQVRRRYRASASPDCAPAATRCARRRGFPAVRSRSCACSTRRPRPSSRAARVAAPTWACSESTIRTSSTSSSARPTATSPTSTSQSR